MKKKLRTDIFQKVKGILTEQKHDRQAMWSLYLLQSVQCWRNNKKKIRMIYINEIPFLSKLQGDWT